MRKRIQRSALFRGLPSKCFGRNTGGPESITQFKRKSRICLFSTGVQFSHRQVFLVYIFKLRSDDEFFQQISEKELVLFLDQASFFVMFSNKRDKICSVNE